MCGIIAALNVRDPSALRAKILRLAKIIRHRGPDWSGIWSNKNMIFAHERLSIVGLSSGSQPIVTDDNKAALVINGEIYNYKYLESLLDKKINSISDCEVVLHYWLKNGLDIFNLLRGDFAFVVTDGEKYMAARDPIGVCPLYWGKDKNSSIWFASEMKALIGECIKIETFPPGHYYTPESGFVRYYNPVWFDTIPTGECDLLALRKSLEDSVIRRMMSDVPFGLLLSGGLDSSLVAAIAVRNFNSNNLHPQRGRLQSFCIGLKGETPDSVAAAKVADYLQTEHYQLSFTIQEGLDALEDVIWHLESYDVTTVRASIPMYLLSRKIKSFGVKMVLSGEGSDEIFGGYLYFHNAPDARSFHLENVERVKNLHLSDCLRANKSTSAFGVEVRVPFLDWEFMDSAFSLDPQHKMVKKDHMEKHILRKAFDVSDNPYLPKEVLWRQKEQFSDGVGYSWIDSLKDYCEQHVSDEEFAARHEVYPYNTPTTKEAFYYRNIFYLLFQSKAPVENTVQVWTPKWTTFTDPSGRSQPVHSAAIN